MLTKSDLEQIKNYLALYGKKDSQLETVPVNLDYPEVTFEANDYLSVVQDSKNKTIKIKDLEKVFLLTFLTDEDFREALKGKIPEEMLENACVTTEKLADGAVTTEKIHDEAVTTKKIYDQAVTGIKIKDGTIENDKIANGAIDTNKLTGTISTDKIKNDAITEDKIQNNAVTTDKIRDGHVTTDKIKDENITTVKIEDYAVTTSKLEDYSSESLTPTGITTNKIADNAVTEIKIHNDAVTTNKLHDDAVTEDKILNGNVTTAKLGNGAVTTDKLAPEAVTTAKLESYTVEGTGITSAKLADGAVTESKLADGAITSDKIADDAITELTTIMDSIPTEGSVKPVTSGGIKTYVDGLVSEYNISQHQVNTDNTSPRYNTNVFTLEEAISQVPSIYQHGGLKLTFNSNSSLVESWFLDKTEWSSNTAYWINVGGLDYKIIKLNYWGAGPGTTPVGGIYYNTNTKLLYKVLPEGLTETIPFYNNAIYLYLDSVWIYNGTDLEITNPIINVNKLLQRTTSFISKASARQWAGGCKYLGVVLTYLVNDNWYTEQFIGSDISGWNTETNWKQINAVESVSVTNNVQTGEILAKILINGVENPIKAEIKDEEPTKSSTHPAQSYGIYKSIDKVDFKIDRNQPLDVTFIVNKYYNNSNGTIRNEDGWVCTELVDIWNKTARLYFDTNSLYMSINGCFCYNSVGTFLGRLGAESGSSGRYVECSTIFNNYPTTTKVKFNLYKSGTPTLTPEDISDFVIREINANSIVEQINTAKNSAISSSNTYTDTQCGLTLQAAKDYADSKEDVNKLNRLHYDASLNGESYIISPFNDTYDLKTRMVVNREGTIEQNPCFKFKSVVLVNKQTEEETVVHNCDDDITPANFNGTYIGANHANGQCRVIICNNHGKTAVDVGSVWKYNNTNYECTLVGVPDENTLWFIGYNTKQYPLFNFQTGIFDVGSTLKHYSGATHTEDILIGAKTTKQWHSAMSPSDITIIADGKIITESGDYLFNHLDICENYDVYNTESVLEKLRAAVGTLSATPNANSFSNADKVVRHSIVYGFDSASDWKISTTFIAYQDITLDYFGFTQQGRLFGSNLKMYIPKTLPIADGGTTLDFRTIANFSSLSTKLDFTSTYWENQLLPPDRWLEFGSLIGLHSGYLFDYGVGGNSRKDYVNTAITLETSRKCYPHGIDSKISVNAGDSFSSVVWRTYKDVAELNQNGVISINVFEFNNRLYIYGDFKSAGIYEIKIPTKYIDKEILIHEKSSNVSLMNEISTNIVLVSVTTSNPMYGYLVARIS